MKKYYRYFLAHKGLYVNFDRVYRKDNLIYLEYEGKDVCFYEQQLYAIKYRFTNKSEKCKTATLHFDLEELKRESEVD